MQDLHQLKSKDIINIREEILKEQEGFCALCGCEINESTGISLDHQHGNKSDINGEDGKGLIRGVLCRSCNVLEGKIWNNMRRFLQPQNVQERIEWLESLIEYYSKDNYPLIHPLEEPKSPKISKRQYNKCKKYFKENYTGRKKFPEYPKSGKLNKSLKAWFDLYNINPYLK